MRRALLSALLLVSCSRGQVAPTASVVAVTLDGAWSTKPWLGDPPGPPTGFPVNLSTTVVVPESLAGQPVTLVLEGLWWSARVWLDDQQVGALVGGRPPARLVLSEGLSAGPHTLALSITGPKGVSKFAHGGGLGSATSTVRPTLHRPPTLEFGAPTTLLQSGVRMGTQGATAFAFFDPDGPAQGGSVHLYTALDGRVQTDFGTWPVEPDGSVRTSATPVDQPLWNWGEPALTNLIVELRDAAGAVTSTWSTRTGLRSTALTAEGLQINDHAGPAVAIRVPHGLSEPDLLTVFSGAVDGGVNAVELHGAMVDSRQLDIADELGIPIIQLPRCVGRIGQAPGSGDGLQTTLEDQDRRLVRGVGAHPSVVSWLVEGDRQVLGPGRKETSGRAPWTRVITSDPMKRPVAGVDLPGTLLRITDLRSAAINCPAGCGGKWIVEATFRIEPSTNLWGLVASAWGKAFAAGIPGGTLPSPRASEQTAWNKAFAPVLDAAGVAPFPLDRKRRASSRVLLEGGQPGSLVWVSAPGMTPEGVQVAADGTATLDVWHDGEATVSGVGWSQEVSLSPMTWTGTKLYGYPAEVSAGG